jgi:trimethylamine:corrinoid methyltransferase-like protein
MQSWSPSIAPPLNASETEEIYHQALEVLEKIGIECDHEETTQRLIDEVGASYSNGRIHFPAASVDAHVNARRAQLQATGGDEPAFSMTGCWCCLNYCDPETLDVRPATSDEVALMARFWDAREISGAVPVLPGDVPPELATLAAEHIGLTHSRGLGGKLTVMDPEEVRFLVDMNLAAGRTYNLVEQVSISPLKFNAKGLDALAGFLDTPDVRVKLGGSIPMAGATCPLDPRGAAVQAVAERLSLDFLCTVLGVDGPGIKIRIEPFDFQYSTIVFGSPEWCLYAGVALSVNAYLLGGPDRNGMFRSVAKQPDAQAACERTASVLFQAAMGVRCFGAVGQLAVDEVFSPQQAVIDGEILAYAQRMAKGIELDGGGDILDLIREGVDAGQFIGVPDTTNRFREFYDFPELFRHWNAGRWRTEGSPSILSEAWTRAQERIASSTFQLPQDQQESVDRIYAKASEYVRTRD